MKTNQLKNHIRKIRINWFFASFFAVIALICIISSVYLTEHLYDKWLMPNGTIQMQEKNIQRAIDLHPTRIRGYTQLLNLYASDDLLTEKESEQLQLVFKDHQSRLNKSHEDVEQLYRDMAFLYLTQYDGNAESRFKPAYGYFQLASSYSGQDPLEDTATDTYLTIGYYYSEYLWLLGTTKEPSAAEISDVLRQFSTMADSYQKGSLLHRLAYSCTLADILTQHGALWMDKIGAEPIDELISKITMPLNLTATSESEKRLQAELLAWYRNWEGYSSH